jgi:hypothetical protein
MGTAVMVSEQGNYKLKFMSFIIKVKMQLSFINKYTMTHFHYYLTEQMKLW